MSAPSWFDWKNAASRPSVPRVGRDPGVDIVEGVAAVDLRLARSKQVQVRSLENEGRASRSPSRGEARADQQPGGGRLGTRAGGMLHWTPQLLAIGRTQRRPPPAPVVGKRSRFILRPASFSPTPAIGFGQAASQSKIRAV